MNAFHAYDIRGIYNKDFTKQDAYKIGYFLPELLNTSTILVGRDVRESSDEIFENLTKGICHAGANVFNVGISTTPMIYFLTARLNLSASVMITASHNPKEYNGMKISGKDALPIGYDTGLSELQKMILTKETVPVQNLGKVINIEEKQNYLNFLNSFKKTEISDLKICVDCSNGMAALLIKDVLGESPYYIFDELDGTFPNHEANPLVESNLKWLKESVLMNKSDIGIIFDGDADRVMFVDENANFISPDLIIGLMGNYFLKNKKDKTRVLQDIRTSKGVKEYLQMLGNVDVHTWRVGRAFASPKLKEIDGLWGGELAGHYYFKDFNYSDSGILSMLIVLDVLLELKKQGKTISQEISKIRSYFGSGEINFKIENKVAAMNKVRDFYLNKDIPESNVDFDGYRVDFKDWWFNIRPSNTEPYLRLILEANNENLLKNKKEEIISLLSEFI